MMTLGAQLYTLRSYTQNEKDLAFCLKKVAEMGYTTVQISAIGPIPAQKVRSLPHLAAVYGNKHMGNVYRRAALQNGHGLPRCFHSG